MCDKGKGCKARRCCDEWHCHHCGLFWDVKDPEPPACPRTDKNQKPVVN